jgi:hypothetical protein
MTISRRCLMRRGGNLGADFHDIRFPLYGVKAVSLYEHGFTKRYLSRHDEAIAKVKTLAG